VNTYKAIIRLRVACYGSTAELAEAIIEYVSKLPGSYVIETSASIERRMPKYVSVDVAVFFENGTWERHAVSVPDWVVARTSDEDFDHWRHYMTEGQKWFESLTNVAGYRVIWWAGKDDRY
jgi:hypothetical protein